MMRSLIFLVSILLSSFYTSESHSVELTCTNPAGCYIPRVTINTDGSFRLEYTNGRVETLPAGTTTYEVNTGKTWTTGNDGVAVETTGAPPATTTTAAAEEATAEQAEECNSANRAAKISCNGVLFSGPIMGLLQQFSSAKGSGNTKEACEKAADLNKLGGLANLAFGIACYRAQSSCVTKCSKGSGGREIAGQEDTTMDDKLTECEQLAMVSQLSLLQVAQSATQFVGAKACADAASGKCIGENAINDPECTQYCMKPGRQNDPKCRVALNNCSDPTYRQQNAQACQCLSNPLGQGCNRVTGPLPPPLVKPLGLNDDPGIDLSGLEGVNEYDGNQLAGTKAQTEGGGNGGGGFGGGGGGGSFPFGGGDGNQGSGDEALDKDILGGTGGGGGGMVGGGGGGFEGGGGGSNSKGSRGDSPGFDLRAFLPGGKKDPKRGLASAGYTDQSITKANGLSNFEKVTNRMNVKRGELEVTP